MRIALIKFRPPYSSGSITDHFGKGLALIERTLVIADKLELHIPLFENNLLTAQMLAQLPELDYPHQFLTLPWYRTKTVNEPFPVILQGMVILNLIEFTIEQHPLTNISPLSH